MTTDDGPAVGRSWHDGTHAQHVGEALSHAQRCAAILGGVLAGRGDDPTGDDADDGSSNAGDPNAAGLSDGTGSRASSFPTEVRAAGDGDEMVLEGAPIIYNRGYQVNDKFGSFSEAMAPGAAGGCITQPVTFLYNHDGLVLARCPGSLELTDTPGALRCRATLNDTTASRDLYAAIKRGDVTQMSIGFVAGDDEWDASYTNRVVKRIAQLIDVSAVANPASPTTWVNVARSGDELADRRRRREEALRDIRRIKERRAA